MHASDGAGEGRGDRPEAAGPEAEVEPETGREGPAERSLRQ